MRRWVSVGMTAVVAASVVGAVGAAGPATASTALATAPRYELPKKGVHAASSNTNLIDHGGAVLSASSTYAIWWGSAGAFPSDAKTGITALLSGFGGSNYLGIAQQYMRGAAIGSAFGGSVSDGTAPPSHSPSVSTMLNEVVKEINAGLLPYNASGLYLVYTANFPRGGNFCAWHSAGQTSRGVVQVAYMPNTTGIAGCDPGTTYNQTSYSQGTRSLANVSAHEFMETVTDPVPTTGWADSSGSEIGDKCAWQFGATVNLTRSPGWQLQEEWSNAMTGCAQGS